MQRIDYTIKVCRFKDAPWAHGFIGAEFKWAWRVTGPDGNTLTGATVRNKTDATKSAKATTRRMHAIAYGSASLYQFRIKAQKH